MIGRVRRSRPPNKGLLARVEAPIAPVRRVPRARPSKDPTGRTYYVIDWGKSLESLLQLYLMTSYTYYELNRSVITDHEYDQLCKVLYKGWNSINHPHKSLTDRDSMLSGTGYGNNYTNMVKNAAMMLLNRHIDR